MTSPPANPSPPTAAPVIGAVAIGRNEGERLHRCLRSLSRLLPRVVYVDSGSHDGSVEFAEGLGVYVVDLDTTQGFTAARARNAGWQTLLAQHPEVTMIQFVDGDCEVVDGWLDAAQEALAADRELAIVCGRRRERHPSDSIYNRLCDLEWNTPVGEALACGGDNLASVAALREVQGYDDTMIAGEEPEMCLRLRQRGWRIQRLDADMTWHDAAMTRLAQWFKRCERAGHAYAQWVAMHGQLPERPGGRESRSIWFWALIWPLAMITVAVLIDPRAWWGLLAYPLQVIRTALRRRKDRGDAWADCLAFGCSCVAAKWPQWIGQVRFLIRRLRGRPAELIEYKS